MGNTTIEKQRKLESQYIKVGQDFIDRRKFSKALEVFENCIKMQPRNGTVQAQKGLTLLYLQRIPEAMEFIDLGMETEPGNSECHYIKGYALLLCNQTEEAINSLEDSIRINPELAEGQFHLSQAQQKHKSYQFTSLKQIESYLKLKPESAKGFYWKGMNYFKLKKYTETADAMVSCLEFNPAQPSAHFIVAECYRAVGTQALLAQALRFYDQGLALFPTHADSYCGKAECFLALRHYDMALQCYQQCLEVSPDYERAQDGIDQVNQFIQDFLVSNELNNDSNINQSFSQNNISLTS